ncbi:hypothetical protein AHiyo1_46130 [Arthrobacter sp. Hiyo1]|nr:hypothetical protein AHiyo1_46130 [Arthrobacter sp. Hiyo1]
MSSPAAAASSSMNRWSEIATAGRVRLMRVPTSLERSIGMVVTTTAPALSTPSQAATIQGLFGPRSMTRLPGTTPRSSVRTWATWLARCCNSP